MFNYDTMTISDNVDKQAAQSLRNTDRALKHADASVADMGRVRYILPESSDFHACW